MKVYGKIIDESGDSLPGANISSATYTNIVEASDVNGKFELESDKITNISPIKISFVGYKDQYIVAKDLQGKEVVMVEDMFNLKEVVITKETDEGLTDAKAVSAQKTMANHFKKYATPYTVALSMAIIMIGVFAIKKAK